MINLTEQQVGEFSGTNAGSFALELKHTSQRLYGKGRFYEPRIGSYSYEIQGVVLNTDIILDLSPLISSVNLGRVQVNAKMQSENEMSGRWVSTLRLRKTMKKMQV